MSQNNKEERLMHFCLKASRPLDIAPDPPDPPEVMREGGMKVLGPGPAWVGCNTLTQDEPTYPIVTDARKHRSAKSWGARISACAACVLGQFLKS